MVQLFLAMVQTLILFLWYNSSLLMVVQLAYSYGCFNSVCGLQLLSHSQILLILSKWLKDREPVSDPTTLDNRLPVVEPTTLGNRS